MARQTFQGRMRLTGGSYRSVIDKRDNLPKPVLVHNPTGLIQLHVEDLGANTLEVGMLPAYTVVLGVWVLRPAAGGTVKVDLPAYGGQAAAPILAATAADTAARHEAATIGMVKSIARPLTLTGTAATTGPLNVALEVVALDNARSVYN